MGLLDKTNPAATRRSVIRSAISGGITAPILIILLHIFNKPMPQKFLPIILITSALAGSGIAALGEWQIEDREEKETEMDPPLGVWDREIDG
jgi:hypothetical protein